MIWFWNSCYKNWMWFWNRFEILGILLKIFIFIGAFCFFDKAFFLCKFRQKEYFWNFSYLYFKLLQNYNQCVNIPKTVSEISTMGESIQIKKVHSVYITLWTLHLRKEGDSNPRYPFEYVSLANWWFQPLTHPSKGRFVVDVIFQMQRKDKRNIWNSKLFRIILFRE